MSIIEIITLFGVMSALAALPGASVALVITRSVTLGVANGLAVSAGIVMGDLVFILLAIFSLSVVAETMGSLFMVIKYLGAIYLLWVGITLLSSETTATVTLDNKAEKCNLATSFFSGFFLTLGDIKAIFFYVSLFPTFLDMSALHASDAVVIISVMVFSIGGVKALFAFSATKLASVAKRHQLDNTARKTAGVFILGAGSYLIVKA